MVMLLLLVLLLLTTHLPAMSMSATKPVRSRDSRGLPLLADGRPLELSEGPVWRSSKMRLRSRVWPLAGALCRYLAVSDAARGSRVIELGCGAGAVGCFCAAALGPSSVTLTGGRRK